MMHGLNEVWICVCLIIAREEERMSKLNGREGVAEFVWSVDSYIHMNAETTVCRIEMWFAISGLDAFQHIWTFRLMPINVFFQINYRIMILCRVLNVQFALMHSEFPANRNRYKGKVGWVRFCKTVLSQMYSIREHVNNLELSFSVRLSLHPFWSHVFFMFWMRSVRFEVAHHAYAFQSMWLMNIEHTITHSLIHSHHSPCDGDPSACCCVYVYSCCCFEL